jgi:arsenite-transporting ATPase
LQRTREILTDARQSALLFVLTPEKLPILETGRAIQSLLQEKLPLAGLVVNRILPDTADGDFLAARRSQEKIHLAQIERDFATLPRYKVPLQATDIQGLSALQHMAILLEHAGL